MQFSMLFDFVRQLFKFIFEILAIKDNFVVLLAKFNELLAMPMHFFLDGAEFALVVLPAHLMFFKLSEEALELIPFKGILFEWILEFIV